MVGGFTEQEGLAAGIEVYNFKIEEQPHVIAEVPVVRNLEEDIAVLDNHKAKLLEKNQQPQSNDFCLNVAISALLLKQEPSNVDTKFTNLMRNSEATVR